MSKNSNVICKSTGMSLVAVMVGLAMLGILATIMSQVWINQFQAQKDLDLKVARMAVVRNLNARIVEYCPQPPTALTWVPAICDPTGTYLRIPSNSSTDIVSLFDPANPGDAHRMGDLAIRAKCTMVGSSKTLKVEAVDAKKLAIDPQTDKWFDVSPKIPLACFINR